MIKKILILAGLICLNNCVGIGFNKGLHYQETSEYKLKYLDSSYYGLSVISAKSNNNLDMMYSLNECGGYFLIGPIIPFIPIWENKDCDKNVTIAIDKTTEIKVKFNDKIYNPIEVQGHTYTFPILIKSFSDGAILVAEKDGEKFEIPFRYQHTFSFDLWPGR